MLLELGSNVNSQNKRGQTPLMISTKHNNLELFMTIINFSDELKRPVNLNLQDSNSNSVAHYICQKNLRDFLLFLYDLKIDMCLRNRVGLEPLELCNDVKTHEIFAKFGKKRRDPVFGWRCVKKGVLKKASRYDRMRNFLLSNLDWVWRKKQAEQYVEGWKMKSQMMRTATSTVEINEIQRKFEGEQVLLNLVWG